MGHSNDVTNVDSLTKIFLQPETSTSQRNPKPKQTTTQRKVRKVHLEGSAGTGKSISCKKLAYDWATGNMSRFLLVFLLELRYITGGILDAIFDQILPNDMHLFSKEELHDYILQHPDQILFVIDGLNEVSSRAKLFQETILQKCHVLVTSRPYPKPLELDQCDTFCKIMGYTKENSLKYVMKFFKDNGETSRQVMTKVEDNRSLRELAVNPLDIMLICSIWKETSSILISGKTELYMATIHCLRRFCSEKGWKSDLKDHSTQQLLRCLGKLAWDGLRKGELAFVIDLIKQQFPNAQDMLSVDILTREISSCLARKNGYAEFVHITFQEYMAAHFLWSEVASEVRDESYSLWNELKHMLTSPKLNDVHKFFKGIFKHNSGSMANQERLAVLFKAHHDAIKDSEGIDI
ncbi:protein NLRC5-like [Branchiostoma floridae x Branchiostoma belcheri]